MQIHSKKRCTLTQEKKSINKKLEEKLFYKKESSWTEYGPKNQKKIFDFAEKYKDFLGQCKTERLCINYAVSALSYNFV